MEMPRTTDNEQSAKQPGCIPGAPTVNHRAALAYAQRLGWPVFPIHWITEAGSCSCSHPECDSPGKHPLTAQTFKEATRDEMPIRAWWSRWPQANIGIPSGAASGFDALDVDPRNGGPANPSEPEPERGKFSATVKVGKDGGAPAGIGDAAVGQTHRGRRGK